MAARLDDGQALELRTLPPDFLLPGDKVSHEVKCLAVGHRVISVPHSPTSLSAVLGPNPMQLGQVGAQHAKQGCSHIEVGLVRLTRLMSSRRQLFFSSVLMESE